MIGPAVAENLLTCQLPEILRQGSVDTERLPGKGVQTLDFVGVKHGTGCSLSRTDAAELLVKLIPQQGMAQGRQMGTDLMTSSGYEQDCDFFRKNGKCCNF